MRDYDNSNEVIDVAHHCKNFKSSGKVQNKVYSSDLSVSCLTCQNWKTDGCISDSYDGALKCMEKNQ